MKKIGALMLAVLVSMTCVSAMANYHDTDSVQVLTAVPHTTLNPSLRVLRWFFGMFILMVGGTWIIYRVVKGLLRLNDGKQMYVQA